MGLEVCCARQIDEKLRVNGNQESRCGNCLPDYLAKNLPGFIPNQQCFNYIYSVVVVKPAFVFRVK